ncbi:MAG TPA: DNA (cytosine-5-)-methyltransferase [Candidatus Nanoarchaeia archaeon]|nr:DNA (cytosine-5-)-methyltransferase [Candidatus Nanoarchaeia archaeon]
MNKSVSAIDLFCGVGGLTHGLELAGIKVVAGIDSDVSCKYAYEHNNKAIFIEKDITHVTGEEINKLYPKDSVKILVGCAPCQTFSQHTKKIRNREKDPRWNLLYHFLRIIKESKPDIVSMENVTQLRNYKIFEDFLKGLKEEGYNVNYKIAYCPRYGIPQMRKRLLLLASNKSEIKFIEETHKPGSYISVKEKIGHLSKISDGGIHKKDMLHRSWKLSPINKIRIKSSKPGGSWLDWDKKIRLNCHKKKGGATYKAVYGRMSWDKPSPTITTQFYSYGTGRFGHPEQNRAISLREGAILQTFPEDYSFIEENKEISFNKIGRHIGNAVPVKLGEVIGKSIKSHIQSCAYDK